MFAWDRRLNLQTPYSQPKFPPCCWWFGYKKRCLDLHIQSPIVWPSFNNPISLMVTWRSLDLPIWLTRKPKGPLKYWLSEILAQICSLSPISLYHLHKSRYIRRKQGKERRTSTFIQVRKQPLKGRLTLPLGCSLWTKDTSPLRRGSIPSLRRKES